MGLVTQLLQSVHNGDTHGAEDLVKAAYSELRRLAAQKMASEAPGATLQPTALVHEAWIRLFPAEGFHFENRAHFFSAAAEAMRRILIDSARRRLAAKRGGGTSDVDLDSLEVASPTRDDDVMLRLNEAFEKFAALHPEKAEVVKLRYFVGMNFEETAAALGIAVITAKKWWAYARAWLRIEMTQAKGQNQASKSEHH